ncbi:MAG: MBL fold hydrolase [Clostridiales bacterium GWF2_36_10]|nr:MAG: MBL fold hydrolase [Clostridiales bacterium GWF2_36_10]HAN20327.1 MBL fold hydrolase [Clostridiales bacterium]
MNLTFYGAAKNVTGSCFMLSACGKKILIDCGMKQGCDECENENFGFNPAEVDYVLLTHAHIDHSGRLPLLVKKGYKGPIIATSATCKLIDILLRDSAKIQEMDAKWENQKGKRADRDEVQPLYTTDDVEDTLTHLLPHEYDTKVNLCKGVDIVFTDVGHLLGSASISVYIEENGKKETIVFSGDIGNINQPIINDPQYLEQADYVVMEATYGNREHEPSENYTVELAQIFESTFIKGGNVIIPSFSVGRTQQLLYYIRKIKEQKLIHSIPDFAVYVDSPLSIAATKIYSEDLNDYADEETEAVIERGVNPLSFNNLHFTQSSEASKLINADITPKVIISSSGMCEAGRIRHHLKHNLWRSNSSVVFVGYQANGTLGRIILDGVKKVKLFGEEIAVKATIYSFSGLSAHADRTGLIKWVSAFKVKPKKVFIVHSEEESANAFKVALDSYGYNTYIPNPEAEFDLLNNKLVFEGSLPLRKIINEHKKHVSSTFAHLEAAGRRLLAVINKHEHAANKDIKKFTDQIDTLINKWDF